MTVKLLKCCVSCLNECFVSHLERLFTENGAATSIKIQMICQEDTSLLEGRGWSLPDSNKMKIKTIKIRNISSLKIYIGKTAGQGACCVTAV